MLVYKESDINIKNLVQVKKNLYKLVDEEHTYKNFEIPIKITYSKISYTIIKDKYMYLYSKCMSMIN